jgi:DNA polymerase III delta prime subunit
MAHLSRPELESALLQSARQGPPLVLTGPPGAGKTTLLRQLATRLAAEGAVPIYLDLMGACSTPERFVIAALRAIPAEGLGRRLPQATQIRRIADSGRLHGVDAANALFRLWATLDDADGRPVVLLLDEATEIRSLSYFPGLRHVQDPFAAALKGRKRGTILATSFPTAARKLWSFETLAARPLTPEEMAPALRPRTDAEALARLSFGWPRYVSILLEAMAERHADVASAWADEMAPGRRLESACRHTYETLLLRSRGYGICKAALGIIAEEEGLNLTAIVPRLGRTPGAVRDYLQWLVGVDAIRMLKKRYVYVDGVLRQWVRLHARGSVPTHTEVSAAARELLSAETAPPRATLAPDATAPPTLPASEPEPLSPNSPSRRDSLIEID